MQTLFNSNKLCVWVSGPNQVRFVLKTYQPTTFNQLNKMLAAYPADTRQARHDEPQFRLTLGSCSAAFYDQLVGLFGAEVVRCIRGYADVSSNRKLPISSVPSRI